MARFGGPQLARRKGNITRRGKSSWRLKFDLPRGPDGQRRYQVVTVRGGKKNAQAKLAELLASVGKGTYVAPSTLKVGDHVQGRIGIWHNAADIGNATRERYDVLLKKQIVPHIGSVALQKLSTADVEAWHATMRASGLAPRTLQHAHKLLSKALGDAVRHGMLTRNVCGHDGQRAPKVVPKEMKILTADQVGDVVDKLRGHPLYCKGLLAMFCGLRGGEVLALRWRNVDLDEAKVLKVDESVEEIAGQPVTIKRPKTAAGIRKLTMPDIVVGALRDHHRRQLELRMAMGLGKMPDDALVFPALDGGPTRRTALSISWRKTVAELGLPTVTFHELRHTHASQLIAAKVDVVTVSKRLGHANPAITLRVYSHLFEKDDAAAADAINAAFGTNWVPKNA